MGAPPPPPPQDQTGQGTPGAYPPPEGGQHAGAQPYATAPGQPSAAPPYDGPAQPSGTNGMAVGALVCGILAIVCGVFGLFLITLPFAFLLGIIAVVLGIFGVRRAKATGNGRGQAISGIVTGAIGFVAALGWVAVIGAGWSAMVDELGDPFEDPEAFEERLEELEGEQDL